MKKERAIVLGIALLLALGLNALLTSCDDGSIHRVRAPAPAECDTVIVTETDTLLVPLPLYLWVEFSAKRGAQKVFVDGVYIGEAPLVFQARTNTRIRVE